MKIIQSNVKFTTGSLNHSISVSDKSQMNKVNKSIDISNFNSIGRSLISFKGDANNEIYPEYADIGLDKLGKLRQEQIDLLNSIKQNEAQLAAENQRKDQRAKELDEEKKNKPIKYFLKAIVGSSRSPEVTKSVVPSKPLPDRQTVEATISRIESTIGAKSGIEEAKKQRDMLSTEASRALKSLKYNLKILQLDDKIAGYKDVKSQLEEKLLQPILASCENPKVKPPNLLFLYGPEGVGKHTITSSFKDLLGDSVDLLEYEISSADKSDFETKLSQINNDISSKYTVPPRTGTCSNRKPLLVVIDDSCEIMSNDKKDNSEQIYSLKNLISRNAQIKDKNITFLIVEHSTKFDSITLDKSLRVEYIGIEPPAGADMASVLEHYIKRAGIALEKLKALKNSEDVDSLSYEVLNRKSHDSVKKLIDSHGMSALSISDEKLNLFDTASIFGPNTFKGAYSNADLQNFVIEAFNRYIQDPSISFDETLITAMAEADSVLGATRPISKDDYRAMTSSIEEHGAATRTDKLAILNKKLAILGRELFSKEDTRDYYQLNIEALATKYAQCTNISSGTLLASDAKLVETISALTEKPVDDIYSAIANKIQNDTV